MEAFLTKLENYCKQNNIEIFSLKQLKIEEVTNLLENLTDNEPKKKEIATILMHNYLCVKNLMNDLKFIPYDEEFKNIGFCQVYEYMQSELDNFQECLIGSMLALT